MPPTYPKSLFFIFIDGLIEANGALEYAQVYSEYISEYGAKLPYLIVYKHFFRIEYVDESHCIGKYDRIIHSDHFLRVNIKYLVFRGDLISNSINIWDDNVQTRVQ